MIVQRTETEIRFKFEPKEWAIRDREACHEFIHQIRDHVTRPWDPQSKFWTIDRKKGEELFEKLREELFTDPNQPSLF